MHEKDIFGLDVTMSNARETLLITVNGCCALAPPLLQQPMPGVVHGVWREPATVDGPSWL